MTKKDYSKEFLLELYRKMALIRHFEERVKFLFLEGIMPGTIHQCQGQEATAVGVCAALNEDDVVTSTHRPHGHCLAKGLSVDSMMAELFGKVTGCCKGKGGSMHIGDLAKGVVPAIAIVGGNLPLAAGAALAFKMRNEKRVAVSFMGDGATNEGVFHETLNMAALWQLPFTKYFADFLSPIFRAFIVIDSGERPSFVATLGVLVTGNIFLSTPTSAFDHSPTLSFFVAITGSFHV